MSSGNDDSCTSINVSSQAEEMDMSLVIAIRRQSLSPAISVDKKGTSYVLCLLLLLPGLTPRSLAIALKVPILQIPMARLQSATSAVK